MNCAVVIPFFNEEYYITNTLICLANQQTASNIKWEVIFVNNNCIDKTPEIIEEFCRKSGITYSIIQERRQGTVYSRRTGLDKASKTSSDILISTDADTTFPSNLIQSTVDSFAEERIDILSGRKAINPRIRLWKKITAPEIVNMQRKIWNLEYSIFGPYFFGSHFAIRTKFYRNILLFNPENHEKYMGEDILLSRRCHYLGGKFLRSKLAVKPHDRRILLYQERTIAEYIGNVSSPYDKDVSDQGIQFKRMSDNEASKLKGKLVAKFSKRFLWSMIDAYVFWVQTNQIHHNARRAMQKALGFINHTEELLTKENGIVNQAKIFNRLEADVLKQINVKMNRYLDEK